ncbi:HAD-IIIC family phosphatase [Bdellovibrio sp. HCB274]|uniref:HAD-IIIC family phosphatase n=1 Tax=Bdellovibrio sp. HCB274 TaxID=3394361 RepID=UPI0039B44D5F
MKRLVFDLDGTLTQRKLPEQSYLEVQPRLDMILKLKEYKAMGFDIIIQTSRNMRTYANSIGHINAKTLPIIISWLEKYNVPFDEIHVGKPWCGEDGFYIDDRAVRPAEFLRYSKDELDAILAKDILLEGSMGTNGQ